MDFKIILFYECLTFYGISILQCHTREEKLIFIKRECSGFHWSFRVIAGRHWRVIRHFFINFKWWVTVWVDKCIFIVFSSFRFRIIFTAIFAILCKTSWCCAVVYTSSNRITFLPSSSRWSSITTVTTLHRFIFSTNINIIFWSFAITRWMPSSSFIHLWWIYMNVVRSYSLIINRSISISSRIPVISPFATVAPTSTSVLPSSGITSVWTFGMTSVWVCFHFIFNSLVLIHILFVWVTVQSPCVNR